MKLKKAVMKASDHFENEIEIIESNDLESKEKFHITNIPGLVINNSLVSEGKVLTIREIEKIFKNCESFV